MNHTPTLYSPNTFFVFICPAIAPSLAMAVLIDEARLSQRYDNVMLTGSTPRVRSALFILIGDRGAS